MPTALPIPFSEPALTAATVAETAHSIESIAQLEALFGTPGEASLSKEYGFPVSFLFMHSGPPGGNVRNFAPRGGRKHGRR